MQMERLLVLRTQKML